jgi:hypothetical protein
MIEHDAWVANKMGRRLPDATRKNEKTEYGDDCGQVFSEAVFFTGLTPDGTKATFELANGGVAIVPYPKRLRGNR